jgi:hypothetical protein
MKIDNLEVRTNPFKKPPVRKKDGLHQIKIRVFIGSNDYGKFWTKITLEVTILDESNNPVLASSSDFENRKSNKSLNLTILNTEAKIRDSVVQMIKDNTKLTSTNLFNYLYKKRKSPKIETAADSEETLWNDEVEKFFDGPVPVSVWEKYKLAVIEDNTKDITEEEMRNIADGVYFDFSRDKETKRVRSMSFNERYQTGNYDKSNIFEVFGYCWSSNPKNGEPLITGSYKSLIVQLNDYRFNAKPSESVKDFNYEWIEKFFKYLVLINKYQNISDLLDKSELSVRRIAGITGHSVNTVRRIKQLKEA